MKSKRYSKNMENPTRGCSPSTCLRPAEPISEDGRQMTEDRGQRTEKKLLFSVFCLLNMTLLFSSGCGPKYTYSADKVSQAIEEICQKEYELAVDARVT